MLGPTSNCAMNTSHVQYSPLVRVVKVPLRLVRVVRVWFVKIFSLSLRVDPRLKNEVYMHYFLGLSLVHVKVTIVPQCYSLVNAP